MEPSVLKLSTESTQVAAIAVAWEMTRYVIQKSREDYDGDKIREEYRANYAAVMAAARDQQPPQRTASARAG
jgi:hypothetical protein